MLKALIIDDHKDMRANLYGMLQSFSEVHVMGEASGVEEGLKQIKRLKPDLIFLDIEMKDGTGFDLLSQLENRSLKVIFVTGHDAFAIKAFKFSAIDYLLKPVDIDDLEEAIEKAVKVIQPEQRISTLLNNAKELTRLVLSDVHNTYLIDLKDIIRIESDVNYSNFFLTDDKKITVAKTLKTYDEMLSNSGFFRSHQSHLINLTHFDRLDKSDGGIIRLRSGDSVPISSRKKDELLHALQAFTFNNH